MPLVAHGCIRGLRRWKEGSRIWYPTLAGPAFSTTSHIRSLRAAENRERAGNGQRADPPAPLAPPPHRGLQPGATLGASARGSSTPTPGLAAKCTFVLKRRCYRMFLIWAALCPRTPSSLPPHSPPRPTSSSKVQFVPPTLSSPDRTEYDGLILAHYQVNCSLAGV